MRHLEPDEIVAELRAMDAQILGGRGRKGESIFKQAADLIEHLAFPHKAVKGSKPMVLYFPTDQAREEFKQLCLEANQNLKPHDLE